MSRKKYPDGRNWDDVKVSIMFKEYNDIMAMDILKRIPHWPNKKGIKGLPQIHKLLQWIVAVYDPHSPLQAEYRGDIKAKRIMAAEICGFTMKKGVWEPDIYDSIITGSLDLDDEKDPDLDEKENNMTERFLVNKVMDMITGYIIYAGGHKWQNLCSYENYYIELLYQMNKPLSSGGKDKDIMDALTKKDKLKESLESTSKLIEKSWEELIQEDTSVKIMLERQIPVKPENQ